MHKWTLILLSCLVPLFIISCADTSGHLLYRDYTKMTDEELLRYYYELHDEIDKCEHRSSGATIGFGTGVGVGRHSGVGFGIGHGIDQCNSDQLRERRIEVRLALKKRGLNP